MADIGSCMQAGNNQSSKMNKKSPEIVSFYLFLQSWTKKLVLGVRVARRMQNSIKGKIFDISTYWTSALKDVGCGEDPVKNL